MLPLPVVLVAALLIGLPWMDGGRSPAGQATLLLVLASAGVAALLTGRPAWPPRATPLFLVGVLLIVASTFHTLLWDRTIQTVLLLSAYAVAGDVDRTERSGRSADRAGPPGRLPDLGAVGGRVRDRLVLPWKRARLLRHGPRRAVRLSECHGRVPPPGRRGRRRVAPGGPESAGAGRGGRRLRAISRRPLPHALAGRRAGGMRRRSDLGPAGAGALVGAAMAVGRHGGAFRRRRTLPHGSPTGRPPVVRLAGRSD